MVRLVLLIILAAAVVALKASATEAPAEASALPVPGVVAEVGASGLSVAAGTVERARYGVGTVGSFFVRPTVLGMAEKNDRTVAELRPAIQRATGIRQEMVRDIHRRMAEADSTAAVRLDEGRPIAAVRYAMKGRGLLDAIRHQVVEETIR
ncbi:MAG TPA: hypothetical protein VK929_15730 [Longimicrobiales bacterium]|nr:hypothetical protein [Longimicrobiales bacterium]